MPAKNRIKIYGEDLYYHAYNRGSNRETIFYDEQDYATFLYLFKKYLEPGFTEIRFTPKGEPLEVTPNHVYEDVDLLAYTLMPNHFHLFLFQRSYNGITKLLRRLCSNFSTYFNKKYQKEGSPFQDIYKAVVLRGEEQFLHLSRYIHANPLEIVGKEKLASYPYSSYQFYSAGSGPKWLKMNAIISLFSSPQKYQEFVESYVSLKEEEKAKELEEIKDLILE